MDKKWPLALTLLLVLALALTACGQGPDTTEPPEIRFGVDVCVYCGMIISEQAYATAYWSTKGEARLFDDLGDMILYQREKGEAVASWWVVDFDTEQWLRAEQAYYVQSLETHSPMGWNFTAFADRERAQQFAEQRTGVVFNWEQLHEYPFDEPPMAGVPGAPAPAQDHNH